MENDLKIVNFHEYCERCIHWPEDDTIEGGTCDICMSITARENSHKPEKFEEKK